MKEETVHTWLCTLQFVWMRLSIFGTKNDGQIQLRKVGYCMCMHYQIAYILTKHLIGVSMPLTFAEINKSIPLSMMVLLVNIFIQLCSNLITFVYPFVFIWWFCKHITWLCNLNIFIANMFINANQTQFCMCRRTSCLVQQPELTYLMVYLQLSRLIAIDMHLVCHMMQSFV